MSIIFCNCRNTFSNYIGRWLQQIEFISFLHLLRGRNVQAILGYIERKLIKANYFWILVLAWISIRLIMFVWNWLFIVCGSEFSYRIVWWTDVSTMTCVIVSCVHDMYSCNVIKRKCVTNRSTFCWNGIVHGTLYVFLVGGYMCLVWNTQAIDISNRSAPILYSFKGS